MFVFCVVSRCFDNSFSRWPLEPRNLMNLSTFITLIFQTFKFHIMDSTV